LFRPLASRPDRFKKNLAITVARDHADEYERVLDLGCGKAKFSRLVQRKVSSDVVGVDISLTALRTAKARFPSIDFICADIPPIPCDSDSFDLVIISELLWYVLPDLQELIEELGRVSSHGAVCLIIQYFPYDQSYGNDIMSNYSDLKAIIPYDSLRHLEMQKDDGIITITSFQL
jgi:SAM-dependent methyltransferase